MRGVAFMGVMKKKNDEKMADQNFCARYFALSWKLLMGELSTQLRWLSRITASTSMARACAIRLSKSMLPVPSSMLSVFRIKCHPFYTGKQKLVDTGGRVDRFNKRYAKKG